MRPVGTPSLSVALVLFFKFLHSISISRLVTFRWCKLPKDKNEDSVYNNENEPTGFNGADSDAEGDHSSTRTESYATSRDLYHLTGGREGIQHVIAKQFIQVSRCLAFRSKEIDQLS
jgi:hypothetical protein